MTNQDEFYVELGSRIRQARLELHLTQEQLAEMLSLNRTSITNIEKGKQKILAHTLVDLAEKLQTFVINLLPKKQQKTKAATADSLLPEDSSPGEREFLEMVLKQAKRGKENARKKKTH